MIIVLTIESSEQANNPTNSMHLELIPSIYFFSILKLVGETTNAIYHNFLFFRNFESM